MAALRCSAVLAFGCAGKAAAPAPARFVDRPGTTSANASCDSYAGLVINSRCRTCHNPASELRTKPALEAWVNEKTCATAARHSVKISGSTMQNNGPTAT